MLLVPVHVLLPFIEVGRQFQQRLELQHEWKHISIGAHHKTRKGCSIRTAEVHEDDSIEVNSSGPHDNFHESGLAFAIEQMGSWHCDRTMADAHLREHILHIALIVITVYMYCLNSSCLPTVIKVSVCCCVCVLGAIEQTYVLSVMCLQPTH